ncbi:hypothetical protein FKP32DRAFT_1083589 [Trametes sanguinea]|nr:hypothetical protein FKP32DRAFT_1083589 [Trametes sanguinea]
MMAEAAHLSAHTDLGTGPSATLVTDKVDPDALLSTSTATRAEAGKTSGSPAAGSESQPPTFIVNLSIQNRDDQAKHADGKKHDGPKSEPRPDGAGEPRKASEVDGSEVIAVGPPSLSVDPQGAGSPSPSAISDQAESESVSTPVDISCPPGLEPECQSEAALDAPAQTSQGPHVESNAQPINSSDDAAVARGPEAAAPPGALAQTPEVPRTETEPQSLPDSASDKPAIPHDPTGGPYIHDDIFEIDLSIFQTYNRELYSLAGLQPLDAFIPDSIFPEQLLVHDPHHITNTPGRAPLQRDAPVTYVRIFPRRTNTTASTDTSKIGGRAAHLYLSGHNRLGIGHHSTVYRAPLELRLDPSSRARSRVSVAVKVAEPACGPHAMLWQEGRLYNTFPKVFMEDVVYTTDEGECEKEEGPAAEAQKSAGLGAEEKTENLEGDAGASAPASQAPQSGTSEGSASASAKEETSANTPSSTSTPPEIIPAIVPKFFGFYAPVLPTGEISKKTHAISCGLNDRCEVNWPTPILLVEECGKPIELADWSWDQRYEILDLYERLHEAGFVQCSPYMRNMLVQPGPLSAPREQRSMDTPSFRIIDFGRGEALSLGCRRYIFYDLEDQEKGMVRNELRLR